jgi:hypothetical protein
LSPDHHRVSSTVVFLGLVLFGTPRPDDDEREKDLSQAVDALCDVANDGPSRESGTKPKTTKMHTTPPSFSPVSIVAPPIHTEGGILSPRPPALQAEIDDPQRFSMFDSFRCSLLSGIPKIALCAERRARL